MTDLRARRAVLLAAIAILTAAAERAAGGESAPPTRMDMDRFVIASVAAAVADADVNLMGEFVGTRALGDGTTEAVTASVGALGGGGYRLLLRAGGLAGSAQDLPAAPADRAAAPDYDPKVFHRNGQPTDGEAYGRLGPDGGICFLCAPDAAVPWDYVPADGGALAPRPPHHQGRGAYPALARVAPASAGAPAPCGDFAAAAGANRRERFSARIVHHVDDWFRIVVDPGTWGGVDGSLKAQARRHGMIPGTELVGIRAGDRLDCVGTAAWASARASLVGDALSGVDERGRTFELRRVQRVSPTLGAKPPPGAVVLFAGADDAEQWRSHFQRPPEVREIDGAPALMAGASSKRRFHSYTLHLEFFQHLVPWARYWTRGNSGVFLHDRWEVTVGDSFGYRTDGMRWAAGGIFLTRAPLVNAALPPLRWQTFDIDLDVAADGSATISARHNGVLTVDRVRVTRPTAHGHADTVGDGGGHLGLEGGGGKVWYRNIWLVERKSPRG